MNSDKWRRLRDFLREYREELAALGVLVTIVSCFVSIIAVTGTAWLAGAWKALRSVITSAWLSLPITLVVIAIAALLVVIYMVRRFRGEELIGRDEQIKMFRQMLRGKTKEQILAIHGEGGVGKSLLMDPLIRVCDRKGVARAKVDFRESSLGHLDILDNLASQLGKERFASYVQERRDYDNEIEKLRQREYSPDVRERLRQMMSEVTAQFIACLELMLRSKFILKRKPVVLLFDSVERISNTDTDSWLRDTLLVEVEERLKGLILVIAGRERLSWEDEWQHMIAPYELERFSVGLTEECMKRMIGGVVASLARIMYELTKGHPLCVGVSTNKISGHAVKEREELLNEMLAKRGPSFDVKTVSRLSIEKIIEQLRKEREQDIASAIRYCPVPRWFDVSIIQVLLEKNKYEGQRILDKLVKYAFVRPRPLGGYVYHEIARDILIAKWLQDDVIGYRELNGKPAKFYEERLEGARGEEWQRLALERLYHELIVDEDEGMKLFMGLFEEADQLYRLDFCESLLDEVKKASLKKRENKGWTRYHEGYLWYRRENRQRAEEIYQKLVGVAASDLQVHVFDGLGRICYDRGEFVAAAKFYEQALSIKQRLGDESEVARILTGLGEAYMSQGRLDQAIAHFNEASKVAQRQGDIREDARSAQYLGLTNAFKGNLEEALAHLNRALSIFQELGNREEAAKTLNLLGGFTYRRLGRWDEAVRCIQEAIETCKNLGNQYHVGRGLNRLGEVFQSQGRWDEAESCHIQAMEICGRLRIKVAVAGALISLGNIYLHKGLLEGASDYINRGLRSKEEIFSERVSAWGTSILANLYRELGKWEDALHCYSHSIDTSKRCGDKYLEVRTLASLCEMHYVKGTVKEIPKHAKGAEGVARENRYYDHLARLQCIQANVLFAEGKYEEGFAMYAEACRNAIRYNRYLLDEALSKAIERMNKLLEKGQTQKAVEFCDYLVQFWQEQELGNKEAKNREQEKGDGKPQTMLTDRLQKQKVRMLGGSIKVDYPQARMYNRVTSTQ